ncbi:MAG: hypothetical protein LBH92_01005 [Bacteroidales bacterium]|jgi:hypothetical protein|nr:hypothetical protein [Bacteroidales bacterium]
MKARQIVLTFLLSLLMVTLTSCVKDSIEKNGDIEYSLKESSKDVLQFDDAYHAMQLMDAIEKSIAPHLLNSMNLSYSNYSDVKLFETNRQQVLLFGWNSQDSLFLDLARESCDKEIFWKKDETTGETTISCSGEGSECHLSESETSVTIIICMPQ